jgi:hypothetical protein
MRTRHVHVSVPKLLALMLSAIAAAPAFMAIAAPVVHASAIADSAATPPPPSAPAPAPAPPPAPAPAPPPAPAPAVSDTSKGAPAPTSAPAPAPAATPPPATIVAPAAGAAAGAAAATPPPLTKKQQRELEKQNKRAAKGKHQKPAKVDSLDAWNKGKSWLSLRAGYARSSESGSADGNVGAGAGYARFLSSRWSLGLVVEDNLLGKFGAGAEIEYPVTLELLRHYQWKTALRPYLGFGGGAYYHKYYRTGDDTASWRSGFYFAGGINAPVSPHFQLGVDGRVQFVSGDQSVNNPLFGAEDAQLTQYGLKLVVARTF